MTVVFNKILAPGRQHAAVFKILPTSAKKRGRRARRDAFYHRARLCRVLTRIAKATLAETSAEWEMRMQNVIVCGTSHPEAWLDWAQEKAA